MSLGEIIYILVSFVFFVHVCAICSGVASSGSKRVRTPPLFSGWVLRFVQIVEFFYGGWGGSALTIDTLDTKV